MKKRIMLTLGLIMLALALLGCTANNKADLTSGIKPRPTAELPPFTPNGQEAQAVCDFTAQLFGLSWQADESAAHNTLISPLSVMLALSMTANGAEQNTLAQLEEAFGLPIEQLNGYLRDFTANLPQDEKYKLHIANSIWLKDSLFAKDSAVTIKSEFLQTNADYYQASVYQAPFDNSTVQQINSLIKQHTDGMIDNMLNEINENAVMYLINALTFEAEWKDAYTEYQVRPDVFTTEDGTEQQVDFMHSTEYGYIQDENTQGFIKYYAGGRYAFAALLPAEGIAMQDYLAGFDGEKLYNLLHNAQHTLVYTSLPKFESETTLQMNNLLQAMGITDAFDAILADFSGMADFPEEHNLYINQVLHKTYIKVDENGTKAGAATIVDIEAGAGMPPENPKEVYLTRPFVYLLIDCDKKLPLFIGTIMSVK